MLPSSSGTVQPGTTASSGRSSVDLYIDFKSAYSYVCLFPFQTIPRDYTVSTRLLPFLAQFARSNESVRQQNMRKYKAYDAARYAKLMGIDLLEKGATVDSTLALIGLLWVNQHKPDSAFVYAAKVFEAFWVSDASVETLQTVAFVRNVVAECGIDVGGIETFLEGNGNQILAEVRQQSDIYGVPCMVINGEIQHYLPCNVSIVRYKLHSQGLACGKNVVPDLTYAYRYPEPQISTVIRGMPGTGLKNDWLSRYHERSISRSRSESAYPIDVYIDIKSPHAYLAMEMSMALEEDFDVDVNFLPFQLPIAEIFGTATKKKGKEKRQTRNDTQLKQVKAAYANIRDLATLQNKKVMGTPKVYDATYISIAMLWAKHCGRDALDRFLAHTYPIMWVRKLNVEDKEAVRNCLVNSDVPLTLPDHGSFDQYFNGGQGKKELTQVSKNAHETGVLGVPSYVLDGEVFWGKEHLSLIRLKLFERGLKLERCSAKNPVDVPFAWRPYEKPTTVSTL